MDAPCLVTDPAQTEHRIERDELEAIPALLALQSHTITDAQPMTAHFGQFSMTAARSRSRLSMSTRRGASKDRASA